MNRRLINKNEILFLILLIQHTAYALSFNTGFLQGKSKNSDLSQFYKDSDVPPGVYEIDIYVNNEWKGNYKSKVVSSNNDIRISKTDFDRLGIKDIWQDKKKKTGELVNIYKLPNGIKSSFDSGQLRVNLIVPQESLNTKWEGYVDPKFWQQGIPGYLLSYQANYYHAASHHQKSEDSAYISLNSGFNLLGWQLRDNSVYNYSSAGKSQWRNNTRYVQRNFSSIDSQIRIGDSYTTSDLFDSYRFRGVSLGTDIRMFPDSLQGFAPVVHGVAQTNALVKIIQNGVSIYQQSVSPGPFAINDILPTGSGGDLHVEVDEADGRIQRFIVPYSSVPDMLKPGVNVYNLTMGQVRIPGAGSHPNFLQGTWRRGISNLFTLYTGGIGSSHYHSALIGTGLNLPFGAISLDATLASQDSTRHQPKNTGQSYRLAFSKFIASSGTNIAVAAYRYSTGGFLTLEDAVQRESNDSKNMDYSTINQKNSLNFNINQNLGGAAGSFFFSGTLRNYWGNRKPSKEYQIGYSNTFHDITYNTSVSRTRDNKYREEMRYYAGLSIPFSLFESPVYLTTNATMDGKNYTNSDLGISGTAGKSNEWNYNLDMANNHGGGTTVNTNASYRANASTLNASYSQSSSFHQAGVGMTGSLVAWRGGLLFANQMGDTYAIVDAPGIVNATVNSDATIMTNSQGKALIPYMSPYRKNALTLDTTNPGDGAQLVGNRKDIVPYSGSINYVKFETDQRKTFIFRAVEGSNTPLPFGTSVTNSRGDELGYVGQGSIIFIRSNQLPEQVIVHLSSSSDRTCTVSHPGTELSGNINHCL
ncbi:fimbria/pilus outer membrane usher protein [Pantoea coffeiphila]|uniref:Usher protein FimD n=1 Tax=Pantoea coffeiphila TaxID=1465635 RepID=A0A2S9I6K4_9GAMM|nr:fimbria/pilus outer membrane usher protein [Pantoea coffeiphila]PRD13411.1 usher protein FimD [Pantoea coffeiphila]